MDSRWGSRKLIIMIRKILLGLCALALLGGIVAYFQYNKKHRDIASEESSLKITSVALFGAYSTNEKEANALYLDKVISVTGEVSEKTDEENSKLLVLKSDDDFFGVNASMENGEDIGNIEVGAQVTVKGRCTGGDDMGVIVTNCTLVN